MQPLRGELQESYTKNSAALRIRGEEGRFRPKERAGGKLSVLIEVSPGVRQQPIIKHS